jgi:ankyrin repeat protein
LAELFLSEDSTFAKDIFGWTPYHYMVTRENIVLQRLLQRSDVLKQRLPKLLCAYSRNPIHLAALWGINNNLEPMLRNLSNEKKRHILQTGGIDGMSPLHLIAKGSHVHCLDTVTHKGETLPLLTNRDFWGRHALHIASRAGLEKMCFKLLEMGARSDQLDEFGKSSVDYFLESKRRSNAKNTTQIDGALAENGEASTESTTSKVSYLNKEESIEFFRFAMESPACRYSHGRTFLHSAVELAHPDAIGILLSREFDLGAQDDGRRTPLHYAVLAGRLDMTTALINGFYVDFGAENGRKRDHFRANLSAGDSHGTTALMLAAREKLEDIAKVLLSERERVAIDQPDIDGETALLYAADLEMVKLLVERKCNTTVENKAGRTRLHMAIDLKQEDIALYLLELEGSDQIQERPFDGEGESLLVTACRNGLFTLVEPILKIWRSLLDKGDSTYNQSPLGWACEEGHINVVKRLLIFNEVDVNRAASKWLNLTPLHFSILRDRKEIFDLLLDRKNIDLNLKDTFGETALDKAVRHYRIYPARKLLLHDQTGFSQRVKALKGLIAASPKCASEEMIALISDGLKSIKDKELICEFLVWVVSDGTSPVADHVEETDRISANANETQAQRSVAVFLTLLVTYIIEQGWEPVGNPYDLVMLLGDDELQKTVKGQQIDDKGLDSDMWSCVDYIKRFDRRGVMTTLVDRLKQSEIQLVQKPEYMKPAALAETQYKESINFHPCTSHGKADQPPRLESCNQVHGKLKYPFTRIMIATNSGKISRSKEPSTITTCHSYAASTAFLHLQRVSTSK